MELGRIAALDEKQILNYLGCRDKSAPETAEIMPLVKSCEEKIRDISVCRAALTQVIPIEKTETGICLKDTGVIFQGSDIERHLQNCYGVILMAATIGSAPETEIRRAEVTGDSLRALVLDCCASAAAEAAADMAEAAVKREEGAYYTCRYSPGYGNFDISVQKDFLRLLDAQRQIGLTLTNSGMLAPVKSVTAVIGVSDIPVTGRLSGCDTCRIKDTCMKRKRGEICGF